MNRIRIKDPSGTQLGEPYYLVKVTFRGIGVYQVLWFALEDFVANPNTMGFWGPMRLFERFWVRLSLFGIGPHWQGWVELAREEESPWEDTLITMRN
jgi:hypothetical protein